MSSSEPDVNSSPRCLGALGDRVSDSATFPAMLAENVEIEHPYAPDGPRHMVGRAPSSPSARYPRAIQRARRITIVYPREPRGAVIRGVDLAVRCMKRYR
jgi:hypothetical protein